MTSSIITTAQAAKILGVSARTAQLWIESGIIPSWKTPGGHRRMYETDVLATLEHGVDINSSGWDVLVLAPVGDHTLWVEAFASLNVVDITCLDNPVAAAVTLGTSVPDMLVVQAATVDDLLPDFLASLQAIPVLNRLQILIATRLPAELVASTLGQDINYHVIELHDVAERLAQELTVHAPLKQGIVAPLPPNLRNAPFPVGPNEPRRLAAVHRSGLLYSAQEETLDNLAQLAALSLSAPVALISVLSEDKQWFKARVGLDLRETPRSWAFCNHTVLQTGVQEFRDLSTDVRFADNPAVAGAPHFRYYAGAPITDDRGFALGSLCVIDTQPRELGQDGAQILSRLARQASYEVSRAIRSTKRK